MSVAFIPFNAFSPGGSNFGDQLTDVRNCLPLYGSYFPLRQKSTGNQVADSPVLGAFAHVFPTGIGTTPYVADAATIFAGTRTKLYDTGTNPWTDLSKGGGYAAAGEPGAWRFASFGNDIWAVNCLDATQRRTANAGNFADGIASTFKPIGRFIAPVREFMIIASLANVGRYADEFAWSDANDATWWDDRTGTRPFSAAGQKRIGSRPGQITGFVGGEFGVLYKRRSIHALQLTGGNDIWRLDEISHGVGCALPSSLIPGEDANYFFSGRGFYSQSGLDAPQKISPPEIDQLFTDGVHFGAQGFYHSGMTAMSQEDNLMVGVEDWKTGLKFWFYKAGFQLLPSSTPLNAGIVYDPQSQLWSRLDEQGLVNGLSFYRGIAYPENSTELTSNETVRMVFFDDDGSGNSRRCTFSGQHEQAVLQTERQVISFPDMSPTGRFQLDGVLPVFTTPSSSQWTDVPTSVSVANVSVAIRTANDPQYIQDADDDGTIISPRSETYAQADANEWGWFPHSIEGRVWDITVTIPAGSEWRNFTGLWISGKPVG